MTLRVISLGAGVQSTTMALMAAHGEITPMPDCAIFADTQAEPLSVYHHLKWLEGVLPFPVHRVTRGNLSTDGLEVRVSRKSGRTYHKTLIPFFTKDGDGSRGILGRKCTAEYKVREIIKQVRKLVGAASVRAWRKAGSGSPIVESWIGISTDEAARMKPSLEPWITNRWPLIESGVSRDGCLRWMARMGYPVPPRSACVFCPYHSNAEWRRLRDHEPGEFARAVAFEREARKSNGRCEVTRGEIFLHAQRVPLDEVDFSAAKDSRQINLFINECEGMCGV